MPHCRQPSLGIPFIALTVLAAGCAQPFEAASERALRDRLQDRHHALEEAARGAQRVRVARTQPAVRYSMEKDRRERIAAISGPDSYEGASLELGPDLLGREENQTVALTLREAVHKAVQNNLDAEVARLRPAINRTRIRQAEAAFDAALFANLNLRRTEDPQPPPSGPGLDTFSTTVQERDQVTAGIRKPLTTGGQIRVQSQFSRNARDPSFFSVNEWYESNIELQLQQPLLRNFGESVNRAQIELRENARAESVTQLRQQLLTTAADTEEAYWDLVLARRRLKIQTRLLERTREDRKRLEERIEFDVSPVQITEAKSLEAERLERVIIARQRVRQASDELKRLMHADDLPVSGETVIEPTDEPVDADLNFHLFDAIRTAIRRRPAVENALLQIEDASIRKRVAENQRLPRLDLQATMRFNGVGFQGDELENSYDKVTEGDFVDTIVGLQFELPLGNREAEARLRQRQLERQARAAQYERTLRQVVVDVKNALRRMRAAHKRISSTRASRQAAADNLRAIREQEQAGQSLTPEFLDLKLRRQGALAQAEIREVRAKTDYHIALAQLYRAMGTLLERNGVAFGGA